MLKEQAVKAFALSQISYCGVVHLWVYQVPLKLFEETEDQG